MRPRPGHHLPVAGEAKVQPFPAVEEVLVVETQLRREAQQAGRVRGRLHIRLEAQHVGAAEADVAVHDGAVGRTHLDAHVVEQLERRQAGVGRIDHPLVVGHARADRIEFAQQRLLEGDFRGMGDVYLSDAVHRERIVRRAGAACIVADAVVQRRAVRQGVRLEEIVVLAEVVVAQVAEHGRAADGFRLEVLLGEEVARMHGDVGAVRAELPREGPARHLEDDGVDGDAVPQFDDVLDRRLPAAVFHLGIHFRMVVAEVLHMSGDIGAGAFHQGGIENDGGRTDLLPELVDSLPAAVGPVVDAQERAPAKDEARIRLLAHIHGDLLGRDLLLAPEFHLIGGQAIGALRQQLCSTA